MKFWRRWRTRLSATEKEQRQVHRLKREIIATLLAEIGEPALQEVLEGLQKNQRETRESDYTSLAEIWITARKRYERVLDYYEGLRKGC